MAIRRYRRLDQTVRIPAHHAQSGRKLPRIARLAGQLRQQRSGDDSLSAREDRGSNRARLRQDDRHADGGDRDNVVGLLHATLAIYYAYLDRAPIFVVGATGPMDEGKRRPLLDWIHTANVQGEQVRNYVKWDYQ